MGDKMKCEQCKEGEVTGSTYPPMCNKCQRYNKRASAQQLTKNQRNDPVAIRLNSKYQKYLWDDNNG